MVQSVYRMATIYIEESVQTTTRVVGFALLLKDIHTHNIYIYIVKS